MLAASFMGHGNSLAGWGTVVACAPALALALVLPVFEREKMRFLATRQGFAYLFSISGIATILAYLLTYEQIKIYYGIYYLLVPCAVLAAVLAWTASGDVPLARKCAAGSALVVFLLLGMVNVASLMAGLPRDYLGISKNQATTNDQRATDADCGMAMGERLRERIRQLLGCQCGDVAIRWAGRSHVTAYPGKPAVVASARVAHGSIAPGLRAIRRRALVHRDTI
jgi:hypothetical protein